MGRWCHEDLALTRSHHPSDRATSKQPRPSAPPTTLAKERQLTTRGRWRRIRLVPRGVALCASIRSV